MPAVARWSDHCTGHACFPSRANDEASGDVFVNGRGAHRLGDHWPAHCCGPTCHDSALASGSSTVFTNGKSLGRIGDSVACGSAVASGSGNVFAG
ncbi:MAG: PAAR domain-containing protein [Candidatus Accumulibacter sp.]|jgi:uncharacterized Zn-binding protein involved in type VI secretion|nr:PAAR domain-containing protein [Accumulibacter sp.]